MSYEIGGYWPLPPGPAPIATGVEARVCAEIAARQRRGLQKYGCTLDASPAAMREKLQHLKEELLDAAIYTQWAIEELERRDGWMPPA